MRQLGCPVSNIVSEDLSAERLRQLGCPVSNIIGGGTAPFLAAASDRLVWLIPAVRARRGERVQIVAQQHHVGAGRGDVGGRAHRDADVGGSRPAPPRPAPVSFSGPESAARGVRHARRHSAHGPGGAGVAPSTDSAKLASSRSRRATARIRAVRRTWTRANASTRSTTTRADIVRLYPQFVAGGFMSLLAWWVEARSPIEPAAIDAMFHRWVRPAVNALRAE